MDQPSDKLFISRSRLFLKSRFYSHRLILDRFVRLSAIEQSTSSPPYTKPALETPFQCRLFPILFSILHPFYYFRCSVLGIRRQSRSCYCRSLGRKLQTSCKTEYEVMISIIPNLISLDASSIVLISARKILEQLPAGFCGLLTFGRSVYY